MAASRKRIGFLNQPRELRDQIYEADLVERKACTSRPGHKFAQPALIRVSRQIRGGPTGLLRHEHLPL